MQKIRRFLRQITFDVWGHFSTDDGWAFASHIALSGLMALFPFLIFATSLASFLGTREFANTAVHVIFGMWPSNIAAPIANEVKSVLTVQRRGLLTVSVIAAAYFASNGVEALRIALNRAYRVTDQRSIIFCRLQSLGFVLVGTLSLMAISFLLVLAPLAVRIAEQWFPDIAPFTGTIAFWRYTIAVAVLVLALFMVHIWLPAGRRGLGDILPGIVITLIAWLAAATAFAKYLETFANYVSTYAGLASIMVAIVFLYMLSAIFIVGAEINAAIMIFRKREQQPNLNL
ncbi:YihY/virulence factor BrkB family protein [Brucella suis]|uniref:YihY family protein n=1 Tax=Brucella suis (strain ATCC 23445 / NCTC 10510) TaxID=470137 RepID=B0CIY1_BRUSI|nr:YihY/virulence factor BrkB family protein [Brucella suis]ABY38834.1 YihY family protein [Brucella suis ATCC 23445]AIB18483.1 Inner membrane protein YihY, formerly thought to be RNase BN [Brucella suis bv. 2]AIB21870.1 Inner membrane protein YihY, formerly thought to be RNase BN [Brucella suis bv. 2]AIB25224.1 Inner membrane protein YihY, formerly thought to be RNase BN [Brucella suis bv. 2]AIB28617.1 Inner membrane protein YihY, formerly thought to be RNase BN [Brucella suis bv. 2]